METRVMLRYRCLALFVVAVLLVWPASTQSKETQSSAGGSSQNIDLTLSPADLRIENSNSGGYILFVRKKPDIASVMLTESTEDPGHALASYAMRAREQNTDNPPEKRMLNGALLPNTFHFLLSSTVVADPVFGKAFRIYLPYVVDFGYPEGRHGTIEILDGAFISLRTFSLPYADYLGAYRDNPYQLKITQAAPQDLVQENYNKETLTTFSSYAELNNSKPLLAKDAADLPENFLKALATVAGPDVDLVLCVDATESMLPYTSFVKNDIVPLLQKFVAAHANARFAYEQFRDYYEEYIYQLSPFVTDFGIFQKSLDKYRALGGGDIPEAVDEALYGALTTLDWKAKERIIILVGDAPPHPIPRGKITHEMVYAAARDKRVRILPIVMPTWNAVHK